MARRIFPVAVTIAELAASMGLDRNKISEAVRLQRLPIYRVGVKRLVIVQDAVEWLRRDFPRESEPWQPPSRKH